jgi:hypothetical protein
MSILLLTIVVGQGLSAKGFGVDFFFLIKTLYFIFNIYIYILSSHVRTKLIR